MYYNLCEKKYPKVYNPMGDIPQYYHGIPTDVIESGEFFANGFDAKIRPVKMGYGIKSYDSTRKTPIGTAGCIVTRAGATENPEFFLLSCNHALVDVNELPIGTPIIQPSDGTFPTDRIATLTEFFSLNLITPTSTSENFIDAAIAKIDDINIVRPQIAFMKIPKGIDTTPLQNVNVKKSGIRTGYTTGKILSESSTLIINYGKGRRAIFVD